MKSSPIHYLALAIPLVANLGVVVWKVYWPVGDGLDADGYPIGRDFINIWAGPQLAFSGRLSTLFDFEAYHRAIGELFGQPLPFHNWGAPPFMLLLVWPFSQAPYFIALALWIIITLAAYLLVTASVLDRSSRRSGLLLLTLSPAALINAISGQNGFVTGALFIGGFLALDRRPHLAGLLFGLLAIKPHLGLIIPLVLLRAKSWLVILAAGGVVATLVAASIAAFGFEPWHVFLTTTRAYQTQLLLTFEGFYTFMMTSVFTAVRTSGGGANWAWVIQGTAAIPVVVVTLLAWGRTDNRILKIQLAVSAATLITPYLFLYDLTALSAVAVWRWLEAGEKSLFSRYFYATIWASPAFILNANIVNIAVGPLVTGAVFLAVLYDIQSAAAAVEGDGEVSSGMK